jgi:hypothetical protein
MTSPYGAGAGALAFAGAVSAGFGVSTGFEVSAGFAAAAASDFISTTVFSALSRMFFKRFRPAFDADLTFFSALALSFTFTSGFTFGFTSDFVGGGTAVLSFSRESDGAATVLSPSV